MTKHEVVVHTMYFRKILPNHRNIKASIEHVLLFPTKTFYAVEENDMELFDRQHVIQSERGQFQNVSVK